MEEIRNKKNVKDELNDTENNILIKSCIFYKK